MIRRAVVVTKFAQGQIRKQVIYISGDSVGNALAWEDRVWAAIEGLRDLAGYAVDEDASQRLGYVIHKLVFERTYLIHYRIDDTNSVVQVVNFRHGARLPGPSEP